VKQQTEYYLFNHNRNNNELPWIVTLTNIDRTVRLKTWEASAFQINTSSESFVGQYHFIICKGVLSWDGTKAIIN
jgi:hypothetical protein